MGGRYRSTAADADVDLSYAACVIRNSEIQIDICCSLQAPELATNAGSVLLTAEGRGVRPSVWFAGAAGVRSCRSISRAHRALSSKPAARRCCCRSTEQTDGRVDNRPLRVHGPCFAYYAGNRQRQQLNYRSVSLAQKLLRSIIRGVCYSEFRNFPEIRI